MKTHQEDTSLHIPPQRKSQQPNGPGGPGGPGGGPQRGGISLYQSPFSWL